MVAVEKYAFSNVTQQYEPTLYPGEKSDKWELPKEIKGDFSKLNSIIESKYSREFLKICAFYNKMFPSLRGSDWYRSFYNVPSFTALDQERNDTGTGMSANYLKQIVDQVTARIGTISFMPKLLMEEPTLDYVVYKDECERLLRKRLRSDEMQDICTQVFHDAAVLCFSHVFIDPFTGKYVKANDFELGIFESQFNKGEIVQMLYRDYAFPVTEVARYLTGHDAAIQEKVLKFIANKTSVDFKMYFDCVKHEVHVVIGGIALPPKNYPYDKVLITTFAWDTGFTKVCATSLFDLLYPVQREVNKIKAKMQQLIRNYKGSVPVFNSDVDLAMKSITNGSGECLYVDSQRPVDTLMSVLNPTPLDPALSAEVQNYKTEMYELAGIQQVSFDLENMRSAASVVALDQMRDTVFQQQMQGMANFARAMAIMYVEYMSKKEDAAQDTAAHTDWNALYKLLLSAQVDLKPVHMNDPLGNEDNAGDSTPDYVQLQTARIVLAVIKGDMQWQDLPYYVEHQDICVIAATYLVKFDALGLPVPDALHRFLIAAFVDAVKYGEVQL